MSRRFMRLISVLLCIVLAMCLAACKELPDNTDGTEQDDKQTGNEQQNESEQLVTAENIPMLSHGKDTVYSRWYDLNGAASMPGSLFFEDAEVSLDSSKFAYTVSVNTDTEAKVQIGDKYTFAAEKRGELYFAVLTDANGNEEYYYALPYGYDRSWKEYVYPRAVSYAEKCLEAMANGENPTYYCELDERPSMPEGNDALKRLYEAFEFLGDYRDSAEYLARFTVLEDVYVGARSYSEYQTGNIAGKQYISVSKGVDYYPDGSLRTVLGDPLGDKLYGGDGYDPLRYIYDENGRIAKVQTIGDAQRRVDNGNSEISEWEILYYADKVTKELTLVYDENGVLLSGRYGDGREIIYRCDDQGRVVGNNTYFIEGVGQYSYTYDENGRLVQTVKDSKSWLHEYTESRTTITYEYDENGHLKKTRTVLEYPDNGEMVLGLERVYECETDGQGRRTKSTLIYSTEWDVLPIMYTEYIYADRYFFE